MQTALLNDETSITSPPTRKRQWLSHAVLAILFCLPVAMSHAMDPDTRILVVVLDGSRLDYLNSELMPRCY